MIEIRQQLLTENDCYKAGKKIQPVGVMVHSTGANNPYLWRYLPGNDEIGHNKYNNHWNQPKPDGRSVCVHAFIGKDKNGKVRIYQTLPWDHRGWHAGSKANDTHIGFEICEDDLTDRQYFEEVYEAAIQLCVYLCQLFPSIKTENIIGHYEGYQRGIASNHSDPQHWFKRFNKTMDMFRAEVKRRLEQVGGEQSMPDQGKGEIIYVVQKGDSLSKIAEKYGTTWQVLAEYNNIANPSLIYPGQKIKIPSDAKEKAEKEELLLRIDKLEQEIKALKTENTLLNDKLNKIKEIVG